ncbi:hypothetical protein FKW77_010909 [Venturia effusa]|uniref:Zn(2)-C6 fungal-type domain-containing protein n=1 Tax=Venturia effusa TaxID=50376 RepID=A0A517KYT0_9PEZI|nr:hypothetical protein FKW77_010909 [Venturia effusa]
MPAPTTTRRSHTKSRLGCARCKARKVKCDQASPACGACVRRKEACSFTEWCNPQSRSDSAKAPPTQSTSLSHGPGSPIASKSPASSNVSSRICNRATIDVELTHFFATRTWKTLMLRPQAAAHWRDSLFEVALDHPQFLDALLATSAMHKLALNLNSPNSIVYADVIMLKGVQFMSSMLTMLRAHSDEDCTLLFASSVLVTIWSFASVHLPPSANLFATPSIAANAPSPLDPGRNVRAMPRLDDLISVIKVSTGSRDLARQHKPMAQSRCFLDLVATPPNYELFPPVPEDIRLSLDVLDAHWKAASPAPQRTAIYELQMRHLHELFRIKLVPEWHDMIIGFAIRFSGEMLHLLAERDPCALVMVAYWTTVLRTVEDRCWWLKGWSEELYVEIEGVLEPEWKTHLRMLSRVSA